MNDRDVKEDTVRCLDDALARETELLAKLDELSRENVRLKQEVVRLRDIIYSKEDGNMNMSSKLRDALRE